MRSYIEHIASKPYTMKNTRWQLDSNPQLPNGSVDNYSMDNLGDIILLFTVEVQSKTRCLIWNIVACSLSLFLELIFFTRVA